MSKIKIDDVDKKMVAEKVVTSEYNYYNPSSYSNIFLNKIIVSIKKQRI